MQTNLITLTGNEDLLLNALKVFDFSDIREETRQDYKLRIKLFIDFIKRQNVNVNSFLDFKRALQERADYSVATKNKYLTTARVFLKELSRLGYLQNDITANIKGFSQNKKHKREGLNDKEMETLINKMQLLGDTPQNARIKAILTLLALQGLRQVEITRLEVKDLDLVNKTAFILGKGQDDKELVYLHPYTAKALKDYVSTNKVRDGALFVSQSNNSKNKRLTTRALRGFVKKVLTDLSIDKTTHGFRHFFTTTLIKNYKGDLLEVARYTRHKSLETLQVYNDNILHQADLPRYYNAFNGVRF
jgi:integrase